MKRQTANCMRLLVLGCLGAMLLAAPGVQGQIQIKVDPAGQLIPADEANDPALQPRADINKDLTKALAKAEEYRDRGDFDSALEIVQRYILDQRDDRGGNASADRSADYFTDQTMQTSLKRHALQLIGELPEEGRRLYELRYGPSARALLDEAVAANNAELLESVTRQYFHTKAGYEATYLLGTHRLDEGESLAAAMSFQKLLDLPDGGKAWEPMLSLKTAIAWHRADEPTRALRALTGLKQQVPDGRIDVGERTISLFNREEEAAGWLARMAGDNLPGRAGAGAGENHWVIFRGDAAHNANSSPASPAWDSAWAFETVRDPEALPPENPERLDAVAEQLLKLAQEKRRDGFLTMPASHPLIIGDAVVFRTMRNLRAVHLKTGELLWETSIISEAYEKLVVADSPEGSLRANNMNNETALESLLAQRAWRDLSVGTLCSDGRYVFALEGTGFLAPSLGIRQGRQTPLAAADHNKLVAYDLATDGKPVWEVGGSREFGLEMAGAFFLGPPLPLGGHLYCMAEVTGDIRLVVLDGRTGTLEWSQTLALPDAALMQAPLRRLAGLTPAYSDGVLICPTTAGAVIAIDPARRILLWGRRYSRDIPGMTTDPQQLRLWRARGISITSGLDDEDRWIDAAPTIAEGRVLLTPRDSSEIYCLNLVDGTVAWKRARGQFLYLACAYEGKAILVGRSQVQAFRLADGEPVWNEPVAIETPSGRGIRDGRQYRVPLSTGEIASIDLDRGRIVARSKSRTDEVFGNLASAGGTLVSQSIHKLVGFKSLEELQRQTDGILAQNPDDADALALRGEVRLHAGDEERGLADLRKSLELKSSPRSRALVVASLLEGLRHDFRKYRTHAGEIEKLVDDPRQRGQYLRLHAAGLNEMGDQRGAFREYLKLASADTGKPELERVNSTLTVRSDRWIRPRISEVYRKAEGAERKELDAAVEELLADAAADGEQTVKLDRFLDAFIDLPIGDRAGRLLAERVGTDDNVLGLELLLRRLQRADDREIGGYATARLASLYIARKRSVAAATLLDDLATRFNDVVCLDGKTGRQLVEEWRADDEVAALLEEKSAWPAEKIVANKVGRQGAVQRTYPVRFLGPRGPMGEHWSLALDSRRQNLFANDVNGKQMWALETSKMESAIPPNVYGNYARISGHLLIVVFGTHFVVLDCLQPEDGLPRVLWQQRLMDGIDGSSRNAQVQFRQVIGPAGMRVMTVHDRYGRPLGKVVPIDDSLICYQVGTKLVAADPLTGETLWERRSIARGSDIFGDREHVFVVPPNTKEATTLRAAEGEQVESRPLPAEGTQLSTSGRNVVVWTGRSVQKFDVWAGKTVWEKRMPPGGQAIVIESGEEAVAVLNPHQGSFAIVSADDGRLLVDSAILPDAGIESFTVHRSEDRYVLMTYGPQQQPLGGVQVQVAALDYNNPLVNGFVYGFDRKTGKQIWSTRVENQAFDVDQPSGLPVLVFTARVYLPFQQAQAFRGNQFSVAVIDKRNGRTIFNETDMQSLSQFEVAAEVQKKQLAVNFYRTALELSMTNEPLADPVHAKPLEEKPGE